MSKERDEDAEALERLAVEELLRDTHKASTRAETFGSTAWQTSNAPKANKIFLSRAVAGTVIQNHWKDAKPASRRTADSAERRKQSDRKQSDDPLSLGSSLSGSTGNKSARETKDAGGPLSDRHASRMPSSGKNHRDRTRRTSPREDSRQRTEQRSGKDGYNKTRRDRSRSK